MGVIAGGAIGQWLHNRHRAYMPLFVGACVAAAAFPIWFLINADVGHLPLPISFAAGFAGGALASPPGPNARCFLCSPSVFSSLEVEFIPHGVRRRSRSGFPSIITPGACQCPSGQSLYFQVELFAILQSIAQRSAPFENVMGTHNWLKLTAEQLS